MEARIFRFASAIVISLNAVVSFGASARTANFIIEAPTTELAEKIGKQAEVYRHDLAITWLGSAMPNWSRPCPIHADVAPNLGAGGATSFVFDRGEVFDWDMKIQGSEERILDSVLPHEVTHTIFASHFRRPLPRWADEGACTTVEHASEKNKQQVMLINFLRTDHGIAFDKLFAMKEYPHDVLPLYSEGYSLARYLIEQGGREKFMEFVSDGMKSENWPATTKEIYGYASLQDLQDQWLEWVKQGSPTMPQRSVGGLAANNRSRSGEQPLYRAQSDDRESLAAGKPSVADRGMRNSTRAKSSNASDEGWGPVADSSYSAENSAGGFKYGPSSANSAGEVNSKSVYDKRSTDSSSSSNAVASANQREPEYIAKRDNPIASSASDGGPDHRILLQWNRTE